VYNKLLIWGMISADALYLTVVCIICLGLGNTVQVYIDFLLEGSWLFIKVYIFVTTWFIFYKEGHFVRFIGYAVGPVPLPIVYDL
jgi:hypothetical protein